MSASALYGVAVTALLAVQVTLVPDVVVDDNLAQIGSIRNVGTVRALEEIACFANHAIFDQFSGFGRYVNANPFTLCLFSRNAGRSATAERIQHHIAFVAAGPDDAIQQSQWLLRWIADAFLGIGVNDGYFPLIRTRRLGKFVCGDLMTNSVYED